jgi:predicted anti-sigma-YlaC factor YlaD
MRDYEDMDCDVAREALSARIDGEREQIPAARVDEHLAGCGSCRQWQADAVEQTQLLRRLAGRSQLSAVRPRTASASEHPRSPSVPWPRWALGAVGVVQLVLAVAQGMGVHLGMPHAAMGGHVLNESTAWSAALGVVMVAAAVRPPVAGGLMWVLGAFAAVLSVYVVADAVAGRVTADRILTHLPVVVGAVLAWLVWRSDNPDGRRPDHSALTRDEEIVLPQNASRGRRRGHLRPSDGSAA